MAELHTITASLDASKRDIAEEIKLELSEAD
jgi:hypothetical protein